MIPRDVEPGTKFRRVPIGFTEELHDWLTATADRRETQMAVLVREAVRQYRERIDPQLDLPLAASE